MKQTTQRNADQNRDVGEVKAEVARLQECVLEKLAIDADRPLSEEINRLRAQSDQTKPGN